MKKILKTKVKVGKITQEQYKISVDAVNTRTLITKAQFKTEVSGLKLQMTSGEITPMVYKETVR